MKKHSHEMKCSTLFLLLLMSAIVALGVDQYDSKLIFGADMVFYLEMRGWRDAEAAAEDYLARLSGSAASSLVYESKAAQRAHFREFQMTFAILGVLLCAIIGVVGVLNFFNAAMPSILSRRREFVVLQAVGQTQRQLKAMLVWEGLLYTLGSGLISGLLSASANPLVGRLLESAYWFYSCRYTITPVLLIVPVFALLGYAIPAVMYRQAARQSVVERFREAEA
ncbi:ABC transporter permease [Oscillibacter valericigenes]|uniref:ABC transporter permease n=1 Tax=Oscillibacter valericigenes TaxID=351091 RepID=UPI001F186C45|nr:ABC transporter permease [Oscillibacter valericigenes]